jgi:hypothetical protein
MLRRRASSAPCIGSTQLLFHGACAGRFAGRVAAVLVVLLGIARAATQDPVPPPAGPPGEPPAGMPAETPVPPPSPRDDVRQEPAVEPAPRAADVVTAAVATPAPADYARRWTEAQFEAEIARLAAAHPARVRVGSIGTSAGGRRIALLTLGDLAQDPDRRPAALLVTDLEARFEDRPAGPEAVLFAGRSLLERAESDAVLAELFIGVTLYAVPAPDPDGAFAHGAAVERTCRLERNFPAGWQPSDAVECPQGPYPCSEPETRELARLFAQRTNVAALCVLTREPPAPEPAARTPDAALARIAQRAALDPARLAQARDAAIGVPGGLAAFARARSSACVVALDPWSGPEAPPDAVRPAFVALPRVAEALLGELPRLSGRTVRAERLRERLWLVEVELGLAGLIPTAGADERANVPASVWLDAEGARVAKIGARRTGQPAANLDVPRGRTWRIGHLDGGESVRLYLIAEGEAGGTLRLAFKSLRGGRAEMDIALGA